MHCAAILAIICTPNDVPHPQGCELPPMFVHLQMKYVLHFCTGPLDDTETNNQTFWQPKTLSSCVWWQLVNATAASIHMAVNFYSYFVHE
jgi:hypothetical protein